MAIIEHDYGLPGNAGYILYTWYKRLQLFLSIKIVIPFCCRCMKPICIPAMKPEVSQTDCCIWIIRHKTFELGFIYDTVSKLAGRLSDFKKLTPFINNACRYFFICAFSRLLKPCTNTQKSISRYLLILAFPARFFRLVVFI